MKARLLTALAAVLAATCATTGLATAGPQPDMAQVRRATAAYHDLAAAEADGYGLFTDAAGIACIDKPGEGGMGIHYVKGALVGDPAEEATTPEAVIYQPGADGTMHLVAVEYVVLQDAWDAGNAEPPSLFGQEFTLIGSPNRYGLPPFYELHVWLWKPNPNGTFEDWNPRVTCPVA